MDRDPETQITKFIQGVVVGGLPRRETVVKDQIFFVACLFQQSKQVISSSEILD